MEIYEAYREMEKASGIKEGDTVKVLRTAKNSEMGWRNSWTSHMTRTVGKTLTVESIGVGNSGIWLEGSCNYPFFVLEVVKPAHTIKINGKEIPLSEESYNELKRTLCQETQNDY